MILPSGLLKTERHAGNEGGVRTVCVVPAESCACVSVLLYCPEAYKAIVIMKATPGYASLVSVLLNAADHLSQCHIFSGSYRGVCVHLSFMVIFLWSGFGLKLYT